MSQISLHHIPLLISVFIVSAVPLFSQSSFEEVSERVFTDPIGRNHLPQYKGASALETFGATQAGIVSQRIRSSMKETLTNTSDLRKPAVKSFHPMGVCADAIWEIDTDTGYGGLFAKGTRAPAIVRMSAGGNNAGFYPKFPTSAILGHHRNLAVAVKLFPGEDPAAKVQTVNLLTFDQTGLAGNPSPWFMRGPRLPAGGYGEQYFTNYMAGDDLITNGFERLFANFTKHPRYRAIPASGTGKAPAFLKLVPAARFHADEPKNQWRDFRQELLDLAQEGGLAFTVFLSDENPTSTSSAPKIREAGRLRLGRLAVSEPCDKELHFPHSPNR